VATAAEKPQDGHLGRAEFNLFQNKRDFASHALVIPVDGVPRIDRHSIGADCVVVAAMLEALLPAFVAMRAQALQLASLEFHRIIVMRLDVVGDACSNDLAFG
jgi:hypothetical protein